MTSSKKWKCDVCYDKNDYPMITNCGHTFGQKCITGRLKCFTCNNIITMLIPNYYIGSANNLTYNSMNNPIVNKLNKIIRFIKKYERLIKSALILFLIHIILYNISIYLKNNYEMKVCDIERCNTIISTNGIMIDITINSANISQQILMNTGIKNDYCQYKNILCYLKNNIILTLDDYDTLYFVYNISIGFFTVLIDVLIIAALIIHLCEPQH